MGRRNKNMISLLTFTTLYPNAINNRHGIFVETRLRHLVESKQVQTRVVAPVPWFPFSSARWGKYGDYARVPLAEERFGITVTHPRYPLLPKIGLSTAPFFLAIAALPHLKRIIRQGYDFDIIDAHFYYPDGVAAVLLGKWLGKKVTITARGTDINWYPSFVIPKILIQWASRQADHSIAVCEALEQEISRLKGTEHQVSTLRNGVDLKLFHPVPERAALKEELGLRGKVLLSVGYLVPRKGHDLIVQSLPSLPSEYSLLIVGDGEQHEVLHMLIQQYGLQKRVKLLPGMPQEKLRKYYQAADALLLASDREGWANVLLESMACGTPVVATNIWGTPEVVNSPVAGVLIEERTPQKIAQGVEQLFCMYPDRNETRKYAEQFDWEATTMGQIQIFQSLLAK